MTTITTVNRFQKADFGSPKLGESMLSIRHIALLVIISGIVGYTFRYLLEKTSQEVPKKTFPPTSPKIIEILNKISSPISQLSVTVARVFEKFKKKVTKDQNLHFKVMHKYHDLHDSITFLTDEVRGSNNPDLIHQWKKSLLLLQNTPVFCRGFFRQDTGLKFDVYYAFERLDGQNIGYVVEELTNRDTADSEQQIKEIEFESFLEAPLNLGKSIIARETSSSLVLGVVKYVKLSNQFIISSIARRAFAARLGIGTTLLQKTIKLIHEEDRQQNTPIILQVRKSNSSAIKCYKKNGFKEVRELPGYYNGSHYPEDGLEMRYYQHNL